jgi:hypothetical protein
MSGNGAVGEKLSTPSLIGLGTTPAKINRPRRKLTPDEEREMDEAASRRNPLVSDALVNIAGAPARAATMEMRHDVDPAQEILDAIGDLSDFYVYANLVLIGMYQRGDTLKSGIKIPDGSRHEDRHQGKAGLVLKKGPAAFVSDANYDFRDQNIEIGQWVSIWVTDGRQVKIRGRLCRLVEDMHIRMRIPAPDLVY